MYRLNHGFVPCLYPVRSGTVLKLTALIFCGVSSIVGYQIGWNDHTWIPDIQGPNPTSCSYSRYSFVAREMRGLTALDSWSQVVLPSAQRLVSIPFVQIGRSEKYVLAEPWLRDSRVLRHPSPPRPTSQLIGSRALSCCYITAMLQGECFHIFRVLLSFSLSVSLFLALPIMACVPPSPSSLRPFQCYLLILSTKLDMPALCPLGLLVFPSQGFRIPIRGDRHGLLLFSRWYTAPCSVTKHQVSAFSVALPLFET